MSGQRYDKRRNQNETENCLIKNKSTYGEDTSDIYIS